MFTPTVSDRHTGFTFIEVLIFLIIISMVLLAGATLAHRVTRSNQINIRRLIAAHGADELAQWLRFEAAHNWNKLKQDVLLSDDESTHVACAPESFTTEDATVFTLPTSLSTTHICDGCPKTHLGAQIYISGTPAPMPGVGAIYRRCAQFTPAIDHAINTAIRVEWDEPGVTQVVPLDILLIPEIQK